MELVRPRRGKLALGFVLMLVNRASGLVLPASTKYLVDNVMVAKQTRLLEPLVLAVFCATLIQGGTSFTLTQLLSKEAQRLIAELRRRVKIEFNHDLEVSDLLGGASIADVVTQLSR